MQARTLGDRHSHVQSPQDRRRLRRVQTFDIIETGLPHVIEAIDFNDSNIVRAPQFCPAMEEEFFMLNVDETKKKNNTSSFVSETINIPDTDDVSHFVQDGTFEKGFRFQLADAVYVEGHCSRETGRWAINPK